MKVLSVSARVDIPNLLSVPPVRVTSARDSRLTMALAPLLQGNVKTNILLFMKDQESEYRYCKSALNSFKDLGEIVSACHMNPGVALSSIDMKHADVLLPPEPQQRVRPPRNHEEWTQQVNIECDSTADHRINLLLGEVHTLLASIDGERGDVYAVNVPYEYDTQFTNAATFESEAEECSLSSSESSFDPDLGGSSPDHTWKQRPSPVLLSAGTEASIVPIPRDTSTGHPLCSRHDNQETDAEVTLLSLAAEPYSGPSYVHVPSSSSCRHFDEVNRSSTSLSEALCLEQQVRLQAESKVTSMRVRWLTQLAESIESITIIFSFFFSFFCTGGSH